MSGVASWIKPVWHFFSIPGYVDDGQAWPAILRSIGVAMTPLDWVLTVVGVPCFLYGFQVHTWHQRLRSATSRHQQAFNTSKPARPLGKPSPEQAGSSAPSTGPEQETQGKVQEDAPPPPYPVSYTWFKPKKAYRMIRTSALVAPLRASLEDRENPDWEDIQDHKEAEANAIASMYLGEFKMECPAAFRDGKYGLDALRWWIGKEIQKRDEATNSR